MSSRLAIQECGALPACREQLPAGVQLRLFWLGQAGFLVDTGELRIVIDPYLSDSLAEKYRGKMFPHVRMMAAPIAADELRDVDWVLSTHSHTDHLDPGTVPLLAKANPGCRFLVPRSAYPVALERGVPSQRIVLCNTADTIVLQSRHGAGSSPDSTVTVSVVPGAHEERRLDDDGNDLFTGYVLQFSHIVLYHSGDTIPFPALSEALSRFTIDIALLPVNGRDDRRRANGIPGNMTLDEAVELADELDVSVLIGHHYDMFDFNTIERSWGVRRLAERASDRQERYLLARDKVRYDFLHAVAAR